MRGNATHCRIPSQPTRASRFIGRVLVLTALLMVLAVAGAIEGHAGTHREALDAYEQAAWDGMPRADQGYYCVQRRVEARGSLVEATLESAYWRLPKRMIVRSVNALLERECGRV